MPLLAAISTIDFPYKVDQQEVKEGARKLFAPSYPQVERMMSVFDNTEIKTRNMCKPLDYYTTLHSFEDQNAEYIRLSLEYSIKAIEEYISSAQINKDEITDLIFVSTTGLSTPSLDALIINKSNFIGSSLFADGVAACIITGDNHVNKTKNAFTFLASQSKLYYDTLDVMGWEFLNTGFKVLFSSDIPTIIAKNIHDDVTSFLEKHHLKISDIKNFIFHPGGKKVLTAYEDALLAEGDFLKNTREVMNDNGNMSSTTVLYVMERFFSKGFENGYGLMVSIGKFWNTKIYHISNLPLVKKGPYRYINHPNYMIVIAEIAVIPLAFHLYFTAIVFTILNAMMLFVRIKEENRALLE